MCGQSLGSKTHSQPAAVSAAVVVVAINWLFVVLFAAAAPTLLLFQFFYCLELILCLIMKMGQIVLLDRFFSLAFCVCMFGCRHGVQTHSLTHAPKVNQTYRKAPQIKYMNEIKEKKIK